MEVLDDLFAVLVTSILLVLAMKLDFFLFEMH